MNTYNVNNQVVTPTGINFPYNSIRKNLSEYNMSAVTLTALIDSTIHIITETEHCVTDGGEFLLDELAATLQRETRVKMLPESLRQEFSEDLALLVSDAVGL